MAEDEPGDAQPGVSDPDVAPDRTGGSPRAPGWYPGRANPNDQTYWDGQDWTATRRWTTDQVWLVAGDAPEEAIVDANPQRTGPRSPANPYVALAPARSKATGFTVNVGVLLLLICGVALMYGSVGPWVHVSGGVSFVNFHVSINGIDPAISTLIGINGWVTFIGGILLVIFACFEMTSEEIRLAILVTLIAAVTTVFAVFDMFRVVQKISQLPPTASAGVSVGWGLICVLSAAVLAVLIAVVRLLQH